MGFWSIVGKGAKWVVEHPTEVEKGIELAKKLGNGNGGNSTKSKPRKK